MPFDQVWGKGLKKAAANREDQAVGLAVPMWGSVNTQLTDSEERLQSMIFKMQRIKSQDEGDSACPASSSNQPRDCERGSSGAGSPHL